VAVCGDTAVVGAWHEDSSATGVNGDQGDNAAFDAGAAYVFTRSGTTWSQEAYLKASNADADDKFGGCVAVSGDTLLVGGYEEDSSATGVNGDQSDNSLSKAGAAYVFVRDGPSWSQQAYLKASNPGLVDEFGWSVAVSGDTLVVAAYEEDSDADGVNGDQGDDSAPKAGSAYVFARSGTSWSQEAYVKASRSDAYDFFGLCTAASGSTIVVGTSREDGSSTGVNGDSSDNGAQNAGAIYLFDVCPVSVQATETIRLGDPPNPNAFLPGVTSGPIVGRIWDPVVSAFHHGAFVDFVGVDLGGPINVPTQWGRLLIWPPPGPQLFFNFSPGTPFALAVPPECGLVGVPAWSQGGSVAAGPSIALANGLDLVLGTY
jgi:hypothetical protein